MGKLKIDVLTKECMNNRERFMSVNALTEKMDREQNLKLMEKCQLIKDQMLSH